MLMTLRIGRSPQSQCSLGEHSHAFSRRSGRRIRQKARYECQKLDVTDAYHRGTLKPSQVGVFAYVVPSVPDDDVILICIDLVFPMGWVDSPKFFVTFSETLTDVTNTLVNADLPVPAYGAISALPATEPPPPTLRQASLI